MKRAGFTMIELIFVIVILGILAAVAIPKMSAVKGDAQLATASQSYCSDAVKSKLGVMKELRTGGIVGAKIADIVPVTGEWTERTNGVQEATNGATLSNDNANVYVFYAQGDANTSIGCYVSNTSDALDSNDTDGAIAKGSNIIYR